MKKKLILAFLIPLSLNAHARLQEASDSVCDNVVKQSLYRSDRILRETEAQEQSIAATASAISLNDGDNKGFLLEHAADGARASWEGAQSQFDELERYCKGNCQPSDQSLCEKALQEARGRALERQVAFSQAREAGTANRQATSGAPRGRGPANANSENMNKSNDEKNKGAALRTTIGIGF